MWFCAVRRLTTGRGSNVVRDGPSSDAVEAQTVRDEIARRRGGKLLHLDKVLLHSAPLARGWNQYMGAIRTSLSLPPRLRELAICYVGVLNGAAYEVQQHRPEYLACEGAQAAQLDALAGWRPDSADSARLFSPLDADVLLLTKQMTADVAVEPALRSRLLDQLGEQQLVELVATVAAYNMVSRFLVALDVNLESVTADSMN